MLRFPFLPILNVGFMKEWNVLQLETRLVIALN